MKTIKYSAILGDFKHFEANKISKVKYSLLHAGCIAIIRFKNYITQTCICDENPAKSVYFSYKSMITYLLKVNVVYNSQKMAFSISHANVY